MSERLRLERRDTYRRCLRDEGYGLRLDDIGIGTRTPLELFEKLGRKIGAEKADYSVFICFSFEIFVPLYCQ